MLPPRLLASESLESIDLFSLGFEHGEATVATCEPVAVVRHEIAPPASVAERPFPLQLPVLHLVMLVDLLAWHKLLLRLGLSLRSLVPRDRVLWLDPHGCFDAVVDVSEPHCLVGPRVRFKAFNPYVVQIGLQQYCDLPPDLGPAGGRRLLDLEGHFHPA